MTSALGSRDPPVPPTTTLRVGLQTTTTIHNHHTMRSSLLTSSFSARILRPSSRRIPPHYATPQPTTFTTPPPSTRPFTTTPPHQSWLLPKVGHYKKSRKGRPRVPTGGSTRGTTVIWGDYGLRMRDHDRRVSAAQLKNGEETIRKRLRGMKYRLYMRICANIGVYTSGNESRMGKGKGSFDYWASRVAVSKIIFELKGDLHEQVVRDAFRLAGNKLPGEFFLFSFVSWFLGMRGVCGLFACLGLWWRNVAYECFGCNRTL